MDTDNQTTAHFARHYKQLDLDDRAGWEQAQSSYRRLVHLWHPDRFAQRPREREHAQQQFIDLNKSYNVLRNFYRKNKRLPFETALSAASREAALESHSATSSGQASDAMQADVDASLLSRDPTRKEKAMNSDSKRSLLWAAAGGALLFGTILFFLVLDTMVNQEQTRRGIEVIKQAPQSEFLPSAADIRKSQTRGAFVKPTK